MRIDQTLSESEWQEIRNRGWTWTINKLGKVRLADPGTTAAATGVTICASFHALKKACGH